MAKCVQIAKHCQSVEAVLDYGFNWTRLFSRRWQPDHPYASAVRVRPEGDATGFQYVSSGGQSAAQEPIWPTVLAGTVVDGSITWTAEAFNVNSLTDGIDSNTWSVSDPTGLTITPEAPVVSAGLQKTSALLSDGVIGTTYTLDNEVVTDLGLEYIARIIMKIVA